jgi:hypothetical protein
MQDDVPVRSMGRFVFAKPVAFQAANVQTDQLDADVGYFVTQGHKYSAQSCRDCEDLAFAAATCDRRGLFVLAGICDGHGGAACAQHVMGSALKSFSDDQRVQLGALTSALRPQRALWQSGSLQRQLAPRAVSCSRARALCSFASTVMTVFSPYLITLLRAPAMQALVRIELQMQAATFELCERDSQGVSS